VASSGPSSTFVGSSCSGVLPLTRVSGRDLHTAGRAPEAAVVGLGFVEGTDSWLASAGRTAATVCASRERGKVQSIGSSSVRGDGAATGGPAPGVAPVIKRQCGSRVPALFPGGEVPA